MKKLSSIILTVLMTAFLLTGCQTAGTQPSSSKSESSKADSSQVSQASASSADQEAADIAWPEKAIEIIVPYGSGGDVDFNARAYAEFLSDVLGVPAVVVNVAGSSGVIGATQAKDAKPDGYTVLYHQPPLLISQAMGLQDFGIEAYEMIAMCANVPGDILCVNKSLGVNSMEELMAYTKENPGKLNVSASIGTMNHIMALQMIDAGFDINIVDGGNASERVASLLGNHVDLIMNSYGTVKDYLETGDFIALSTTNLERDPVFPDIPTCIELGYEVNFNKYHFMAFPKGTDEAIVNKMAEAVKTVNELAEYRELILDSYGEQPFYKCADDALKELDTMGETIAPYIEQLK